MLCKETGLTVLVVIGAVDVLIINELPLTADTLRLFRHAFVPARITALRNRVVVLVLSFAMLAVGRLSFNGGAPIEFRFISHVCFLSPLDVPSCLYTVFSTYILSSNATCILCA